MSKKIIIYVFTLILICFLFTSSVLPDPDNIINILDHGSDTREIWLGDEDYLTGKKVDPESPDFWFIFDQPVDTDLIRDALRIESDDPESKCEQGSLSFPEIPVFPIAIENVINAWEMGTVGSTDQVYPRDFNAFIFNDITGIPHSEGPLAAGNNITTENFGINQMTTKQAALVAGNELQLLHGEIDGNVYTEEYYEQPQSVTIHGNKIQSQPIAFKSAVTALCLFSRYLSDEYTTNAYMTNQWGNVYFKGNSETINVFNIHAEDLSGANYIEINAPYESVVLINVEGENFSLGNLGINVIGTDKQHILWNFENAKNISLFSISFPGSILAPFAKVELNNSNLEGTVVAEDLTGTGELHYFPFKDWEKFDIDNRVYIRPVRKLAYDCEYCLVIENYALNQDGGCLGEKLEIPFKTIEKQESTTAFHRETKAVLWDYHNNRLNSFFIKEGINTETENMFRRYTNLINLRPQDTLKSETDPKHTTTDPNRYWTYYVQYFKNIRVDGFGYTVYEEDGFARSAFGRVINDLDVNTNANISEDNAISTACASMSIWQPYPWQSSPDLYSAPSCELVIASMKDHPKADDFTLMWRIDCGQSNLENAELFYIDAANNQVVYRQNKERCIGSSQPVDELQYLGPDVTNIEEYLELDPEGISHQISTPIPSDRYRREAAGTTTDYYALAMTKDSNYNDYTAQFNLKIKAGEAVETPLYLICNDADTWILNDSTTTDPYFYVALAMKQILLTSSFYALYHKDPVTYEPWRGIDGTGTGNFEYIFTPPLPEDTNDEDKYGSRYIFDPFSPKIETPYDLSIADWYQAYNLLNTISHEMTHGIFAATRFRIGGQQNRLNYTGEGGAIEEGLAEIMNQIILHLKYNCLGDPLNTTLYYIFNDPNSQLCPSYYKGDYWLSSTETHPTNGWDDMHTNCAILYHWFYLLSQGGTGVNEGGFSYDVKTIGSNEEDSLIKLASILLMATTELLPAGNATFTELRNATIAAAYYNYAEDADFKDTLKNIMAAWDAVGVYGEVPQIKADSIFPAEKDDVYPWPVHFGCEFESDVNPDDLWLLEIAEKNFKDDDFEESDIIFSKDIPAVDLQEPLITENREVKYYLKPYTHYYWRLRPLVYDSTLEEFTVLHNAQVNYFTTNLNDFALKEEAYKKKPYKEKQYNQIIEEKTTGFDIDFAMLPLKHDDASYLEEQILSLEGGEIPGAFYAEFKSIDVEITNEKLYEENIPGTDFNNRFILEFNNPPDDHLTMCRIDITTGCDDTSDPAVIDPSYLEYDYYFYFMVFDPELYSPKDPDGTYEEVGNYYFDQFAENANEKPYFSWNHLKGKYVPDMEYQLIIYPFSYIDDAIFNDVVDYELDTQTINGYQLAGYQFPGQTANEKACTHSCQILYLNSDNMVPLNYYVIPTGMYGIKMPAPEITYPADNETIDFLEPVVDVTFKQIPGVVTVNDTVSSPGGLKQLRPDYLVKIWDRDSDGNITGDPEVFKLSADNSEYYHQDGDDVTLSIKMNDNPHGYVVQLQAHRIYCPLGEPAEFTFNWKLPAPNLIFPNEGDSRYPFGTDEVIFYWNNDYELDGTAYANTPASSYLVELCTSSGTPDESMILYTGDFEYNTTTGFCSVSSKKFMPDDYIFDYKNFYKYKITAINADGIYSETSEKKFMLEFAPIQIFCVEQEEEYIVIDWECEFMKNNGGYELQIYDSNENLKFSGVKNGYYQGTHSKIINRDTYDFRAAGDYEIHFFTLRDGNRIHETVETVHLNYVPDPDPDDDDDTDPDDNNGDCTPVTDEPDLIGPGIDSGYLFDLLNTEYEPDSQVPWSVWESRVPYGYYAMWDAVEGATEYEIKVVGLRETNDVWEYYYDMIMTQTPPAFTDSKIVEANGQDEFNVNIYDLLTDQTDGVSNYLFFIVVDAYNDCTDEPLTSNVRVARTP